MKTETGRAGFADQLKQSWIGRALGDTAPAKTQPDGKGIWTICFPSAPRSHVSAIIPHCPMPLPAFMVELRGRRAQRRWPSNLHFP